MTGEEKQNEIVESRVSWDVERESEVVKLNKWRQRERE